MNTFRCLALVTVAGVALMAVMIIASPTARAAEDPQPIRSMTSLVAWCGSYSAIQTERFARVTAPEQWVALWTEHCGDKVERDSYGEPVVPQIDFQQHIVLAIFGGRATNVRYEQLIAVDELTDHVRVRYEDRSYQTSSGVSKEIHLKPGETVEDAIKRSLDEMPRPGDPEWGGGNRTTPYGLFVLPRSDKPLIIEESRRGLKKDPITWVERARLEAVK